MVMKVNSINNIQFKANTKPVTVAPNRNETENISSISNVTPDFRVSTPIKYTKTGMHTLPNGLELHTYKLANGYKVSVVPMEESPTVVKNYVNVGAMNETADIKGISHFLEHMAFNGTNGENGHIKLDVGDSFKKIDKLGGWANASTNYAITDYVNSTPLLNKEDLETQIKIIAAMTEDLKLSEEMIAKEKNPVCSEINMILDNPQTIALDQTLRTLYNIKNPTDEMVGGSVNGIKALTRDDVVDYYNKYYTPDNMNLVITGNVNPDEVIEIVAKNFNSNKISQGKKFEEKLVPINKTIRKDFVSDKATSTDIVLGFAGVKNNDTKGKILIDAAKSYLLSHAAGIKQELKDKNAYMFFDSVKVSTNPNTPRFNYIASGASEEKSEEVLRVLMTSIANVKPVDEDSLKIIKRKLLNSIDENLEYSSGVNDMVGVLTLDNDLSALTEYKNIVNSLTVDDVNNAIKEYFDVSKAAITLVHPGKKEISFKGNREPISTKKISKVSLENNFDIGFYDTKNSELDMRICLNTDIPYHKKAGVLEVLNEIYSMGTAKTPESEWKNRNEKNDTPIGISAGYYGINIYSECSSDNYKNAIENVKEILYSPNLTQENLDKAKEIIKDYYSRKQDTAYSLYANDYCKDSPYDFSDDEILKSLDSITLDDVKECHNYILQNSRGIIAANLPQNNRDEVKNDIIDMANGFDTVLPNKIKHLNIYKENQNPKVLTKTNNNSQADIVQINRFEQDYTPKELLMGKLVNSILTSSSIGLFDILREKEHLAYSVNSSISRDNNLGEVCCHILTTTDNKNIGEISYDNVQKSIEGFQNQIKALRDGAFTDEDLNNAKLSIKADLLDKEGNSAKVNGIAAGLNSDYGITYLNKIYNTRDEITKHDIINYAAKMFKNPPIYSIVASKDTIENNQKYFDRLTQSLD